MSQHRCTTVDGMYQNLNVGWLALVLGHQVLWSFHLLTMR